MTHLRAGLRALITEYGRDGGNDDIDDVLDRVIALIESEGGSVDSEDLAAISELHHRVLIGGIPRCDSCHHVWRPLTGCPTTALIRGDAT